MLNHRLNGNMLFLLIVLIAVLGLLLYFLMELQRSNNLQYKNWTFSTDLSRDLASAALLYSRSPDLISDIEIPIYGSSETHIRSIKFQHGLHDILKITGRKGNRKDSVCFSIGWAPDTSFTTFYMANHFRPLVLVGNSEIEGKVKVPMGYVQKGNIKGVFHYANIPDQNETDTSQNTLPFWHEYVDRIERYYTKLDSGLLTSEKFPEQDAPIVNSFGNPTDYYSSNDELHIRHLLSGNIVIYSSDTIFLQKDAELSGPVLSAPNVVIEQGFRGAVQIIASNSITIEQNVRLDYPSELVLHNSDTGKILIDSNFSISGNIICYDTSSTLDFFDKKKISIMKNATVKGILKIDGKATFKENINIFGLCHLEGAEFPSGINTFENHLYDFNVKNIDTAQIGILHTIPFGHSRTEFMEWLD
jgi:hypothetical protein